MKWNTWKPSGLRLAICVVLAAGAFARSVHVDQRPLWLDETYTQLRVSGHTLFDLYMEFRQRPLMSAEDWGRFQSFGPESTVSRTVQSLIAEDPQHPPLYYVLLHGWERIFGISIAAMRSLSILFSLLLIPAVGWFAMELLQSERVAWIAAGLVAVSPIHVLYAQEAREYSLWALLAVICSTCLLRALRLKKKRAWLLYAATAAATLYSFGLTVFVLAAHALYVMSIRKTLSPAVRTRFIGALALAVLLYVPWIIVTVRGLGRIRLDNGWALQRLGALDLARGWIRGGAETFFDSPGLPDGVTHVIRYLLAGLVSGVTIWLFKNRRNRTSLFLLLLITVPLLGLALPDLAMGTVLSTIPRYQLATTVAILVGCAWLAERRLPIALVIVLYSAGVISCLQLSGTEKWWTKYQPEAAFAESVAAIANKVPDSLIVMDTPYAAMSLAPLLNESVSLTVLNGGFQNYDSCDVLFIRPQPADFAKIPPAVLTKYREVTGDGNGLRHFRNIRCGAG